MRTGRKEKMLMEIGNGDHREKIGWKKRKKKIDNKSRTLNGNLK